MIGVATHVLRYWETQFPALAPVRRPDGRRYYRPEDVQLAAGLCVVLREEGLTIRGARRLIALDRAGGGLKKRLLRRRTRAAGRDGRPAGNRLDRPRRDRRGFPPPETRPRSQARPQYRRGCASACRRSGIPCPATVSRTRAALVACRTATCTAVGRGPRHLAGPPDRDRRGIAPPFGPPPPRGCAAAPRSGPCPASRPQRCRLIPRARAGQLFRPFSGPRTNRPQESRFDAPPPLCSRHASLYMAGVGPWRSLVSASVWGAEGREFESRRPDHHETPTLRGGRSLMSKA